MGFGVPIGYDSKADFHSGITSAMRASEKSTISVSQAVKNNYSNLLNQEKANSTWTRQNSGLEPNVSKPLFEFKSLPSMQVTAEDVSDYVQTLDTEVTKVGFSGLNANDVKISNEVKLAEEKVIINTNNASYTSNLGDELISKDRGIQYQTIGHGAGYVEPVKPILIEDSQPIGLWTHPNLEGIESGIASDIAIESVASAETFSSTLPATASDLAVTSLYHGAEILNDRQLHTKEAEAEALTQNIQILSDRAEEKAENLALAQETLGIELDNNISEFGVDNTQLNTLIKEASSKLPYVPYDQKFPTELEPWGGTHEDNIKMQTVYEPRLQEIEAEDKESYEKNLAAIEQAKRDKIMAAQKAKREKWQNRAEIAKQKRIAKELEEERLGKKRLGEDQDPFEGGTQGGSFDKQGGAGDKTHLHNEEAFTKGIADEVNRRADNYKKRIAELERQSKENTEDGVLSGEKEARKKQVEKERLTSNATTTPLGQSQNERLKDKKAKENLESNAKTTPLGQSQNERLDAKKAQEQKEKAAEQRAAHDNFQNRRINNIANESESSYAQLQKVLAENEKNALKKRNDKYARDEEVFKKDAKTMNLDSKLLAGDPYAFSTLSYPSDVTNNGANGHYILFYVNVQNKTKYAYEGFDKEGKAITVGDSYVTEAKMDVPGGGVASWIDKRMEFHETGAKEHYGLDDISYQKQSIKNGSSGALLYSNMATLMKSRKGPMTGINSRFNTTTRITDSVALYLPPGVSSDLSAQYGDSVTGMAGFLALSGIDLVQQIKDHDFAGAAGTLFDAGGTIATEALKRLSAGAFEAFTESEGVRATFDKAFGQTLNPYLEVNYNNIGLRTFDYTFQFAPKSRKETDEVQAIIQLFRFHMAPELKGTNHRYMTLPSTFDIHYMWQSGENDEAVAQENSFYNKIATCVLTGCNVKYDSGDKISAFGDGAPTQLSMTLSFKETEMLTKSKINRGF